MIFLVQMTEEELLGKIKISLYFVCVTSTEQKMKKPPNQGGKIFAYFPHVCRLKMSSATAM